MWEVDGTGVISAQETLHSEERAVNLSAYSGAKCHSCARESKLRDDAHEQKLADLGNETAALERRIVAKRKAFALNAQGRGVTTNK